MLEGLILEYRPKLRKYAYLYLKSWDCADDAVSTTIYKALTKFDATRHREKWGVVTWLFEICKNTCLDLIRRTKKYISLDKLTPEEEADPRQELCAVSSPETEKLQMLWSTLDESEKEFLLMHLTTMPQRDQADELGITFGAYRMRLHKIKNKLRERA